MHNGDKINCLLEIHTKNKKDNFEAFLSVKLKKKNSTFKLVYKFFFNQLVLIFIKYSKV
jgi:hypothetical protein